jgi:Chaperone of endosialidase
VTGTTINAAPFNTNFSAVATAVNSIDNSNIGAAGIFASQLLPTTSAQATFGGTLGYNFLAPSASTTPLTISGVTSQSADIFDVTATSGGTKIWFLDKNGAMVLGPTASFNSASSVGILNDASATNGMVFNVPSGSTNGYRWFTNGSTSNMQLSATGALNLPNGPVFTGAATPSTNTDIASSRSTTTGVYYWGSSTTASCSADFGINTVGTLTVKTANGATFIPITAGAYTNGACDVSLKTDYRVLDNPLATLLALEPREYTYKPDGTRVVGLTAQQVAKVFPTAARVIGENGRMGVTYDNVTALFIAAFQQYVAEHP